MSNPLYALADAARGLAQTSPTSQSASSDAAESPLLAGLTALGMVMLIIWVIRRIAAPAKLDLAGRTSSRPSTLTPVHAVIPLLMFVFASSAALRAWPEYPHKLLPNAIAQLTLMGASLAVAAAAFRNGLGRGLGLSLRHWLFDAGRAAMGLLIAMPLVLGTLAVSELLIPGDYEKEHDLLKVLPTLGIAWKALGIFSAVVLAPLAEETFFRGILQTTFRRYTNRPWVSIACASVVFGAVHAAFLQTVPALIVLGIVLGYNYDRTGRLITPILIHAIFNGVMIAVKLTGV
jgi:hypothetical protein